MALTMVIIFTDANTHGYNGKEEGICREQGRENNTHSQDLATISQHILSASQQFVIPYKDLISNISLASKRKKMPCFFSHMWYSKLCLVRFISGV